MTWAISHGASERFASDANDSLRRGDRQQAKDLFAQAAQAETDALTKLGSDKPRTLGITAVSAAALWFKAGNLAAAERLAHQAAAMDGMPIFAQAELRSLLQAIWTEEARHAIDGLGRGSPITDRETVLGLSFCRYGSVEIDFQSREVRVQGTVLRLADREYKILGLLMLNQGTVLTKETLAHHLSPEAKKPDGRVIDVAIVKLRKQLAIAGEDLIATVWGRGYAILPLFDIEADPADNEAYPATRRSLAS